MNETIPPTKQALSEALAISTEILSNIELSDLPLTNVALKASRLARLLNDFEMQRTLEYEIAGYPSNPEGIAKDVYNLAVAAGREFYYQDHFSLLMKTGKPTKRVYVQSIESLEEQIRNTTTAIAAARDPENSAPPKMRAFGSAEIQMPTPNAHERSRLRQESQQAAERLASRRNFIYQYVLRKHYELKFSSIADEIFSRVRERVDANIGEVIPESVKRFAAAYENLQSENAEDWSNAVHSCRRILRDLADAIFPPTDDREVRIEGRIHRVKLGSENYVNRIIAFINDRSNSERFQDVVGSNISFIGNRLDSIVQAANKGSHDTIVTREEADRYVVFTYLLVGDVLALTEA